MLKKDGCCGKGATGRSALGWSALGGVSGALEASVRGPPSVDAAVQAKRGGRPTQPAVTSGNQRCVCTSAQVRKCATTLRDTRRSRDEKKNQKNKTKLFCLVGIISTLL